MRGELLKQIAPEETLKSDIFLQGSVVKNVFEGGGRILLKPLIKKPSIHRYLEFQGKITNKDIFDSSNSPSLPNFLQLP